VTVLTIFTAPETSEPPTVTVFFVNASVRVGSELAATDAPSSARARSHGRDAQHGGHEYRSLHGVSLIRGESAGAVNVVRATADILIAAGRAATWHQT